MDELATKQKETVLNLWLDQVSRKQKIDCVFELEMWIKCFDRFFRTKNQPSHDNEFKHFLLKDFREELTVVRDVILRMSSLANEIMTQERSNLLQFDRYLSNYLKRDYVMDDFCSRLLTQPTPDDSLALLLDSLADLRYMIDELVKLPEVTFQTFTTIGKLINREIKQCRYIEMLVAFKFKVHFDRVENPSIAALIKHIKNEGLRQDVAKVFLELFRLLRYLEFVEKDLTFDRPLKNSLLIFSLINSELRMLFDFLETRICKHPDVSAPMVESLDATIFALSQEIKKVFSHELVGLVYLRQAPPIYARVENSHGLLKNSLQQSIVQVSQVFDSNFDGKKIFSALVTRLEQSKKLLSEIGALSTFIGSFEKMQDQQALPVLLKTFDAFRESSLRYLMYKDWEEYENFVEEVRTSKTPESLRFTLHRFRIFLDALSGEVGKRSVLRPAVGS